MEAAAVQEQYRLQRAEAEHAAELARQRREAEERRMREEEEQWGREEIERHEKQRREEEAERQRLAALRCVVAGAGATRTRVCVWCTHTSTTLHTQRCRERAQEAVGGGRGQKKVCLALSRPMRAFPTHVHPARSVRMGAHKRAYLHTQSGTRGRGREEIEGTTAAGTATA